MTRRFGKLLSLLLALCMLLALFPAASAAGETGITRAELAELIYQKFLPTPTGEYPDFTDIGTCTPEQQKAIRILAAAGIVNGRQDGTFDPIGTVTRAEAAIIIWRALGQPAATTEAPYTDLDNHFSADAVHALYERGVLTGQDAVDGTFRPDIVATTTDVSAWLARITLTRAEFARLVYEKFRPAALPPDDKPAREEDFPDIGPVEEGEQDPCTNEQRTAIAALYAAYILDGQSDGLFNPKGTVTRAEAVVLIWRAAGRGEATGNPSDIFNNVPENYQPAFNYLVSLGVLTEADAVDGEFGLNRLASFEDVTRWLSRLLTRAELAEMLNTALNPAPWTGGEVSPFNDIDECTEDQQAAIKALYQAGIIAGTQEGKFAPNVPVTYGAAAIVLCRAASGDSSVKDLDLALAYLEVKEIIENTADIQPGAAIPPETMGSWLDKLPEPEEPGENKELTLDVASGDRMVVEIHLPETVQQPETVQVLVARYENGKMTAIGMQEITEEKLCLLTLPDGSGTTYRVFLLDGGESSPLCAAAEASVQQS